MTVKSVRDGGNPRQGQFQVLTLALVDGIERHMAAGVVGAPDVDREEVSGEDVDRISKKHGPEVREAARQAMEGDDRFVWFQDTRGRYWCLADMLPQVGDGELLKVASELPKELQDGEPVSKTTEELVRAVWGTGDDGSPVYELRSFALGRALLKCFDVKYWGEAWVLEGAWKAFVEREPITVPRIKTNVEIPPEVTAATDEEAKGESQRETKEELGDDTGDAEAEEREDLESWRTSHPTRGVLALSARPYYEGRLPLDRKVKRLFPPLETDGLAVTFYHRFGDEEESFRAWLDWGTGRLWVRKGMCEELREHGVYPGARLSISARNEREYELATRPPGKSEPIRVWRMWLENGQIQYEDVLEPRKYDIDDDVFVADVRFEDQAALFKQAEDAGNSIFGLVYRKAVEWWRAGGWQDLSVTVDELFDAIHSDEQGRMTCKSTIAWELWRRMAFKGVGGGKYLFRPQYEDRPRVVWLGTRLPKVEKEKRTPGVNRDRSLAAVAQSSDAGIASAEREARSDSAPQAFLMVMGKRDTQQKAGYSRDIYIPLAARDFSPSFWGWPDQFSPIRDLTAGQYLERRVDILVRSVAAQPRVVDGVRLYFYDRKREFRLNCGQLVEGAANGDILVIRKPQGSALSVWQIWEYEATVIPPTHAEYSGLLQLCTHQVSASPKKWAYTATL